MCFLRPGQLILHHRSDILNALRQVFYIIQVFIPTTGLLVDFEMMEADQVDVNLIYGCDDALGITCSELNARNRREDRNPYRWHPHPHDAMALQKQAGGEDRGIKTKGAQHRDHAIGILGMDGDPDIHVIRSAWMPMIPRRAPTNEQKGSATPRFSHRVKPPHVHRTRSSPCII